MNNKSDSYNVLLIEEDQKQTELYTDLLKEVADCKIDVTARIDGAFEWFAGANYHLVIIDTSSAGLDALSLLEKIRRLSPMTSVIMISSRATIEEAVASIRTGAEDYFKKPFNLESFKLAIKRGLDRKAILSLDSGLSNYINLLNACQMISASLEEEKIFGIVQSFFSRELASNYSAVYTLEGKDPVRLDDVSGSAGKDRAMEEVLDIALQATNPLSKMAETNEQYRFIDRGQLTPGLFVFRFRCAGPNDYYCVCLSPERSSDIEDFESRIRMLRAQIEVTGKNVEQYKGVQHLVYVDDATGLYNTRYLNNLLDREISCASQNTKSFAVLFIDADKFKSINDSHGHLIGTRLLNELGHQLKKYVRETDTVFRYGGDEFVAVLSPSDLATAKAVAERIRHSVERRVFLAREGLKIHFTVSIGVAIFPDHAKSKKEIIEAADYAMYSAKKTTRNKVSIADPIKKESK